MDSATIITAAVIAFFVVGLFAVVREARRGRTASSRRTDGGIDSGWLFFDGGGSNSQSDSCGGGIESGGGDFGGDCGGGDAG